MSYPWASGEVLTAADLNAGIDDHPRVSVYQTTDLTIANTTITSFTFNSEFYDTHSLHSTSTNTSRITVPTGWAGVWLFTASVEIAALGAFDTICYLRKNSSATGILARQTGANETYHTLSLSAMASLAVGDFVEVQLWQNSGGNATAYGTNFTTQLYPSFQAIWMGKTP